ncbi:hypothetical protein NPIL_1071 [Nephila pilipes]|uniref:Uncharacterized protein n=1 Tax=Nephila pilipes TaxID=299642 RepID=A0A8X6MLV1_NEPPI|nr:hypothetical protein NPIL_1071 [Nephila pilipes]
MPATRNASFLCMSINSRLAVSQLLFRITVHSFELRDAIFRASSSQKLYVSPDNSIKKSSSSDIKDNACYPQSQKRLPSKQQETASMRKALATAILNSTLSPNYALKSEPGYTIIISKTMPGSKLMFTPRQTNSRVYNMPHSEIRLLRQVRNVFLQEHWSHQNTAPLGGNKTRIRTLPTKKFANLSHGANDSPMPMDMQND